jgi:dipeptidase D
MKSITIVRRSISATFAFLLLSCSISHAKQLQQKAGLSPQTTQNLQVIKDLEPAELWQHFVTLCSIPHCTGSEDSIASFIGQLAIDHGFENFRHKSNDVLVRIPASRGFENYPWECWQAHLDMVCQSKTGSPTAIYPVMLHREGPLIKANGTTLGADDGFGVAALMALITDRCIKHGPLELLFTTGEEAGFVGATAFDYTLLKSRMIYNVDSEEEGIVTVGAAGIGRIEINIPVRSSVMADHNHVYAIKVSGLQGGHSGIDINKGRANAIKVIVQILKAHPELDVVSISGGSAINTIPREAETIVATTLDKQSLQDALSGIEKKIAAKDTVEKIVFTLQDTAAETVVQVLNSTEKDSILSFISKLPNGMLAMEHGSTTLVRTSNNVSIVGTRNDTVTVQCLFRSSSNKDIDSVKSMIEAETVIANPKAIAKLVGRYAPWEPNFNSPLVKTVTDTYEQIFHKKMIVQTLHGALECAVFAQHIPDAQIVSIGPTVLGAHTPDEAVNIKSVADYWTLVLALLIKK